jgi:hypothetical protein
MSEKYCESCGFPLKEKKDFGGKDSDSKYCVWCCDPEGNLLSYKEVLTIWKNYLVKTTGMSEEKAIDTAKDGMSKMPAWINKKN